MAKTSSVLKSKDKDDTKIKKIKESFKTGKNKSVGFSGRFSTDEDIALYERWKEKIIKEDKSIYSEINNIVKNHLLSLEKEVVVKEFKDDMFYAFRKAFWASMSPFSLSLKEDMNNLKLEMAVLNLKANMIVYALFNNDALEKELTNTSVEYLKEIPYFQEYIRKFTKEDKDNYQKNILKKIRLHEKNFEKFKNQFAENDFDKIFDDVYEDIKNQK